MNLVEKIEAVIKRMRWKVVFCNKKDNDNEQLLENYGLKSESCPPQIKELVPFEEELINLVKRIEFRKVENNFQKKLREDILLIKSSNKTVTQADKTSNIYRLSKEEHDKHLQNAITTTYRKAESTKAENINTAGIRYAKDSKVLDKIEVNAENNCFITLKDHKENFVNSPKTRLINPAKNEIGRVSKVILEKINSNLCRKLHINQWKNTANVIDWFNSIENKQTKKFCVFDIKEFYPSIRESVLTNALQFAKKHTKVLKKDIDLIMHSRKSLLFNNGETWIKKDNENFDVTMGAYDGAEVCELVGIYLQSLLSEKYNKSEFGLYRDDGLAVFDNISGPKAERIKKDFQKLFKENHLDIIIACNKTVVNYLDVTLNLQDGTYRPYQKPDNEIMYINKQSNHPPAIIKQLPISIESRLRNISSSKEIFEDLVGVYQEALDKSGYDYKLTYGSTNTTQNERRNRPRNIIWFNPPFSKSVSTNVGKYFLKLIGKHFPKEHKYHKLFNRNTLKVSYSCLPNMNAKLNQHNKSVLQEKPIPVSSIGKTCNCRKNIICPMNGNCLDKNVLYEAAITCNLPNYKPKIYKGICATTWKERFANHNKAFNNARYQTDSELAMEVWRIKRNNMQFNIKWKKVRNFPSYTPESKKCFLCMNEKLEIARHEEDNLLNKRNEIISRCLHRSRFKLKRLADVK